MRDGIIAILILYILCMAVTAQSQTADYVFDNPSCKKLHHVCRTDFEIINGMQLQPIDCKIYYRVGQADYKGDYKYVHRLYVESTMDSLRVEFDAKGIEFVETQDSTLAHFDYRIGHNQGQFAPMPPEPFGTAAAYTWGLSRYPLSYHNQVWVNYDIMHYLGNHIRVYIHETLHRFNIGHSDIWEAIMYFSWDETLNTGLHQDDVEAIDFQTSTYDCMETITPCDTVYITDTVYVFNHWLCKWFR